ncbi:UNVERIFIED_CONTAM: hypothetical protein HDU68_004293, partial [Siphonaria sp. JEL0065]
MAVSCLTTPSQSHQQPHEQQPQNHLYQQTSLESSLQLSSPVLSARRLSVAKANEAKQVPGVIKWIGNGYSVKLSRRVCTGGEGLTLSLQLDRALLDYSVVSAPLPVPISPASSLPTPTKEPQSNAEKSSKTSSVFPGFAKMISNLKGRKPQQNRGTSSPLTESSVTDASLPSLCSLKVYIEETQTVRAPKDSGDVWVVNEAHATYLDTFVGTQFSPLSAKASRHSLLSQVSTDETHPPNTSTNEAVCSTSETKKLLCLIHSESFEGEYSQPMTLAIEVPPLFGVDDLEAMDTGEARNSFDTPSVNDDDDDGASDTRSLDRGNSPSPSIDSDFHYPSSNRSSFASDSGMSTLQRPSIIAQSQVKQTELGATKRASSRLSQRA